MTTPSLPTTCRRRAPLSVAVWLAAGLLGIGGVCSGQKTGPDYEPTGPAHEPTGPSYESAEAETLSDAPQVKSDVRFGDLQGDVDSRINALLEVMSLDEKIGQLIQEHPAPGGLSDEQKLRIRRGRIGSIFYVGDAEQVAQAQQIARSGRLGIPLLVARDVIHGFRTIFPIPVAQAATWNPDLVERASAVASREAKSQGVDWTFAPMVDISYDPRWGRIAETLGEDPVLASDMAAAMVRGFQQEQDGRVTGIAACAKHFVAYGLAEGGRDYDRASVSPFDLHNVYLPPFHACVEAGCRTLMTTFSEVNGIPGTAHRELLTGVLKNDWGFRGVVVSDWGSVIEMIVHGYTEDEREAARAALQAGVDMEMSSPTYAKYVGKLVQEGVVPESRVDDAVRRILRLKYELHEQPIAPKQDALLRDDSLELAREAARQSLVLLTNDGVLPLAEDKLKKVAIVGPLADEPLEQLGTWMLDGKTEDSITPLAALRQRLADKAQVVYARGAANSFVRDDSQIDEAVEAAQGADVALLFVGEDAMLSGEARSRSSLDLPGVQRRLVTAVVQTGTPTLVVVLAGRPLTIADEVHAAAAVLYAWHPGTMAGPAIADVLLGDVAPSGKLPVTFPQSVGQIPMYYAHMSTGRPAPADYLPLIGSGRDDLPEEVKYRSHYLDVAPRPLFPFGYGLSYTTFEYSDFDVATQQLSPGETVRVAVTLRNTGDAAGTEVSQLYVRDRFASVVRPVRELKAYRRTTLEPGESTRLEFELPTSALAFFDRQGRPVLEPGSFGVWVGGDSTATLGGEFELVEDASAGASAGN